MAAQRSDGPVADFCAALRQLQLDSGLGRVALARQVNYSKSQLYAILDGEIRRPPEWDRVVEPLVRACTGDDERAVNYWRRRHGELLKVYELSRRDRPPAAPVPSEPARVVPAQLPADVDVFTGRGHELAELDRLLVAGQTAAVNATAVVISAVSGTAGVGKTALAIRWSHRVRDEFPDGQLYANLRGYDPDQPMAPGDALAGFLRALGMPGQDIPLEVDERAAAYRSLLDGRRMLVVLDNAATVGQIRPLLPGAPSCLVVVTSRDALPGLVARHGARRLDLDLLPPEDALALLRALIGDRVETERDGVAMLAEQCARLPLALRVAAELAISRPTTSLAGLVAELGDEQRRLDLLDAGGDARTAVRVVFSWSYQHLPTDAARMFRLLGLHPGPDLDSYAAAALTDTDREQAQHLLTRLTRAHLIQPTSRGRHGMHDLLRAYAAQLATDEDSEGEQRAALTRLFDHYLGTAAAVMDMLHPAEQQRRPRIPAPATPTPPVADLAAARSWLDAERTTLVATCAHTAAHGWPGHAIRLARTLFRYLDIGGHYPDALTIHTHALHAARRSGDRSAETNALTDLGFVYLDQGHYGSAADYCEQALDLSRAMNDRAGAARALNGLGVLDWRQGGHRQAVDHLQQARDMFRAIKDWDGEARALTNLGNAYWQQGHYRQATDHHQRAIALCRQVGNRESEAIALDTLGDIHRRQGRYQEAVEHHRESLALYREIGDRAGEARALDGLGLVCRWQNRYPQAAEHHQESLALCREIGYRVGEADALDGLGLVYQWQCHYEEAAGHHERALALFREIGDRAGESKALNGVGEALHAAGQLREACIQHTAALALATEIGNRYEQARAHNGLANSHQSTGEPDQARHHWQQALTLYTDLGVPEADEVQAGLTALDHQVDHDSPA